MRYEPGMRCVLGVLTCVWFGCTATLPDVDGGAGDSGVLPDDTLAPVLSIDQPQQGAAVSGDVAFEGWASDDVAVTQVETRVDTGAFSLATGTTNWSSTIATAPLSDGPHRFEARASDAAGHQTLTGVDVLVVNHDAVLPTVAIQFPAANAVLSGVVTVAGVASDNAAVDRVELAVDGAPFNRAQGTTQWSFGLDTRTLANGAHLLHARAYDVAGNPASADLAVSVQNTDTTPPTLAISAPTPGSTLSGAFTVRGTANDDVSVASVEVRVDSAAWTAAVGTTHWTWALNTAALSSGAHTLEARATDTSGNATAQAVNVTVTNADTVAPQVTISSPAAGSTLTGTAAMTGTASDDVAVALVEWRVDSSPWTTASGTTNWSASISTTAYANGPHTLSVRAKDAAGNSALATRSVTLTNGYTWSPVPIGGGGYVTGIFAHPLEPDLVYLRTDVGGAYRWDVTNARWVNLMDFLTFDERNFQNIDGLAYDPSNANVLYVAAGKGGYNGAFYRSTNRGDSFTRLSLSLPTDGNGDRRWGGERLAVDPFDSNILLYATRSSGVWRSVNAGTSFTQVSVAGAAPTSGVGYLAVAFDGDTAGRVYLAAFGDAVFRSDDHGATWTRMAGSPARPVRLQVEGGILYVASETAPQVARFSGGGWVDITPASTSKGYCALAVNPFNNQEVVAIEAQAWGTSTRIFRSTNGGTNWTQKTKTLSSQVPWWPLPGYFAAWAAAATFDPHHNGRVFLTDWFGIWKTENIATQPAAWTNVEAGHEETVVAQLMAAPSGPPLMSGLVDVEGFSHPSLTAYPQASFGNNQDTYALGYTFTAPQQVVRLGGTRSTAAYQGYASSNGGTSWSKMAGWPTGAMPRRVATSATTPGTFVVTVSQGTPLRSTDVGATFAPVSSLPAGPVGPWEDTEGLAADKVDGTLFYYLDCATGKFFTSHDSGATFTQTATLPASSLTCHVKTSAANEVWVALDKQGLHRSTNAGTSFTKLSSISRVMMLGTGKAFPGGSRPVYVRGVVGGVEAMYRSVDNGQTWTNISDPQRPVPGFMRILEASEAVPGLLFVGGGGRGVMMGSP